MDRPALDPDRIRAAAGPGWPAVEVVARTVSTNADLAGRRDVADRTVLAAEEQTGGRGRLDRSWTSPPRAGLLYSVALRPPVPPAQWGWLPLLTGVATVEAVRSVTGVAAVLKWPNDVLVDGAKLAGILAQSADGVVVVGTGLNVSLDRDELPVPTATSLLLAGSAALDRSDLLGGILSALGRWLDRWTPAGGSADASGLADAYRALCGTVGQQVRVTLADGGALEGVAEDVDAAGRIVVRVDGSARAVSAGDVEHLRPSR